MTIALGSVTQFSQSGSSTGTFSPTSALTVSAGDAIEVTVLTKGGNVPTGVNDGVAYVQVGTTYTDGTNYTITVWARYNCAAGSFTPVITTAQLYALVCKQIVAPNASAACLGVAVSKFAGSGAGSVGANTLNSGNIAVGSTAINILALGTCLDTNNHAVATAGTSPLAFTGGTAIWATLGGGTAFTAVESLRVAGATGNIAATFGVVTGNDFDTFYTVGTVWQELTAVVYTATIKAIAVVAGETTSTVASAAYTISNPTSSSPAPAAANGYNTKTFDSTTLSSTIGNMYPFNFFSSAAPALTQNGDGSILIPGTAGNTYGGSISSAQFKSANAQKWAGKVFGGGAYFQVKASYTGTQSGDSAIMLWLLDILSSSGFTPENVQGYMGTEVDAFEQNVPGSTTQAGFSLHNYCYNAGAKSTANPVGIVSPVTCGSAMNGGTVNTYGVLWVPATSSVQGSLQLYFNGTALGSAVRWNLYNSGQAFPPTGSNIGNIIDTLQHHIIIGNSNSACPMTVTSVQVWQTSDANNATA